MEQEFTMLKDPRLPNDQQDQFDYLISVRDKVSEASQAIIDIHETREGLIILGKRSEVMKTIQN